MKLKEILHTLRNPYGIEPLRRREARLEAADLLEEFAVSMYESEPDCYGDGNVYRGQRSKDSEIETEEDE